MNIRSLFREVRTVRQFAHEQIPRELLIDILDDAVWAPNHRLREPWRFIYFEGEAKEKLAAAIDVKRHARIAETVTCAPAAMIITAKTDTNDHIASEDFAAVCCLIHNIRLLGWERELGMCWDLADYSDCPALFPLAGIDENERIAGILALGFLNRQHDQLSQPPAGSLMENNMEVW